MQLTAESMVSGKKLTMFTGKNGKASGLVSERWHKKLPPLNFQC